MLSAIDKEINTYIQILNNTQKKALLSVIKSFLSTPSSKKIGIAQYNKELDISEAEIDHGEFLSHEEVVKLSKSWTLEKSND